MATPDHERPTKWPCTFELTGEKVWHAFRLHGLLLDAEQRGEPLVLLQSENQDTRLDRAIKERNIRVALLGDMSARTHSCDICHVNLAPKSGQDLKGVMYLTLVFNLILIFTVQYLMLW